MISYMSQISLKNFFGKAAFENWKDAKQKSVIWPPFWNGNFLGVFLLESWIWLFLMYNHIVKYSSQNFAGKVVFLGGEPPPPEKWYSGEMGMQ